MVPERTHVLTGGGLPSWHSVRGGDFSWPPVGTFRGHQRGPHLATRGDFLMATDSAFDADGVQVQSDDMSTFLGRSDRKGTESAAEIEETRVHELRMAPETVPRVLPLHVHPVKVRRRLRGRSVRHPQNPYAFRRPGTARSPSELPANTSPDCECVFCDIATAKPSRLHCLQPVGTGNPRSVSRDGIRFEQFDVTTHGDVTATPRSDPAAQVERPPAMERSTT
jgi:hypothetical protein